MENEITQSFELSNVNSLEEALEIIIKGKKIANQYYELEQIEKALNIYTILREQIEKIIEKYSNSEDTEKFNQIMLQYKFILSNISNVLCLLGRYQESLKLDYKIITKLDKMFDKSYARLVNTYLTINNFTMANYFASLMKSYFYQGILNKSKDILARLEKERSKHQVDFAGLFSGKMKNK